MIELDHLIQLYIAKTKAVEQSGDAFMTAIVGSNEGNTDKKVATLKKALEELATVVHPTVHPAWLKGIAAGVRNSENQKPPNRKLILDALMKYLPAMKGHSWVSTGESAFADPDKIFIYYKSQSNLPELADTIVELLRELLDSDELSENATVNMVKQIKDAIEASERIKDENTGYTNTSYCMKWMKSLAINVLNENMEALPVIGPTVRAINKTIHEMEPEFENAVSLAGAEMSKSLPKGVKAPFLECESPKSLANDKND